MDPGNDKHTADPDMNRGNQHSADHAEIAHLAYCYYLDRGCEPGRDEDDWRRAEQELRRRRMELSTASSNRTVIGVFHSMDQAQSAFDKLTEEGFSRDDISFIANKAGAGEWTEPSKLNDTDMIITSDKVSNVAGDAGIGAAIGGVGGLLLSFAGMAIPGVGPVLAAGPIVAALGGAGLGAAAGGFIGVLTEAGVPEEEAGSYAEGVRRGGILLTVRTAGERAARAAEILDQHGAVDIDDRVSDWRNRGWSRHEEGAPPLTDDELRREREYFAAARRQAAELAEHSKTSAAGAKPAKAARGKKDPVAVAAPAAESMAAQRRPTARIYSR